MRLAVAIRALAETASPGDEKELDPAEHWDYAAIEDDWIAEYRGTPSPPAGITWNRDTGTVTMPAGVIEETRKGRFYADGDDVRSDTAPGARWVLYEPGKSIAD